MAFLSSLWTALADIVARVRGASKAEDDAAHEANKRKAEEEIARREKEKTP